MFCCMYQIIDYIIYKFLIQMHLNSLTLIIFQAHQAALNIGALLGDSELTARETVRARAAMCA